MDIILTIGADFGGEFISQIAADMIADVGIGAAATFIPFIGAVVAAGLDYAIATKMTNRVGQMVSIYFQNGIAWQGSQRETYDIAKGLSGDLDDIRKDVPSVMGSLLKNIQPMIEIMRSGNMTIDQMRDALLSQGIPKDVVDQALRR
jgi:hypothetical protein